MKIYMVRMNEKAVCARGTRREAVFELRYQLAKGGEVCRKRPATDSGPWMLGGDTRWDIVEEDVDEKSPEEDLSWMVGYSQEWRGYRTIHFEKGTEYYHKIGLACKWFSKFQQPLRACVRWVSEAAAITIMDMQSFLINKMRRRPPSLSCLLDMLDEVASGILEEVTAGREEVKNLREFLDLIKERVQDGIPPDKIIREDYASSGRVLHCCRTKKIIGDLEYFDPPIFGGVAVVITPMSDAVRSAKEHLKKLEEILAPFST